MTATLSLDGSGVWRWSHCRRNHEFTPDNIYVSPAGVRACRTCRKLSRIVNVPRSLDLTCPDCGETRTVKHPRNTRKSDRCASCTARRLPQCQPHPKPEPPVVVAVPDWRTEEELLSAEETWDRMTVREQREFQAAMRWLPEVNEKEAA